VVFLQPILKNPSTLQPPSLKSLTSGMLLIFKSCCAVFSSRAAVLLQEELETTLTTGRRRKRSRSLQREGLQTGTCPAAELQPALRRQVFCYSSRVFFLLLFFQLIACMDKVSYESQSSL